MAITVDSHRRPFDAVGFDSMSSYPSSRHFTDPWASTSTSAAGSNSSLFALGLDQLVKQPLQRASANSMAGAVSMPYSTIPVSAPSVSTGTLPVSYGASEMLSLPNQLLGPPRMGNEAAYPSDLGYSSAPSPRTPAPASAAPSPYDSLACTANRTAYSTQPQAASAVPALSPAGDRRWSQPAMAPPAAGYLAAPMDAPPRPRQASLADLGRGLGASRDDYGDAISGSRGIMMLDDDNTTPRNIYDVQSRDVADSYGFPATHSHSHSSSSSSVSSTSPYPSYYSSIDSSMSGYSSTTESIDSMPSRGGGMHHHHRPQGSPSSASAAAAAPPAPQSMMGQFNSKVSSSAQKKHRCRICDKRFTRPSSLRTHMYSHTGEKPFCCDVDGCGRHFSVVSNLRRHRKVHRGERDASSPEEC